MAPARTAIVEGEPGATYYNSLHESVSVGASLRVAPAATVTPTRTTWGSASGDSGVGVSVIVSDGA